MCDLGSETDGRDAAQDACVSAWRDLGHLRELHLGGWSLGIATGEETVIDDPGDLAGSGVVWRIGTE